MARFLRWDAALQTCMSAKPGQEGKNRWRSDPMALNKEAHELPPEKQRVALDMAEAAGPELRAKLAPMWRFCFVQWHVYDAGLEALEKGAPLAESFKDATLLADIDSLQGLFEGGELEKASTTEEWTWSLLEPVGDSRPPGEVTKLQLTQMLKAGREARRAGIVAFSSTPPRFEQAYLSFWEGLKLVSPVPATQTGSMAKLRCDLYKNQAAAALKLKMGRLALSAASAALAIDARDEKAWYRKACALELLGKPHEEEAQAAFRKAGLERAPGAEAIEAKEKGAEKAGKIRLEDIVADEILPHSNPDELDPYLHWKLESMVFIEQGIDSLATVDMVRHIKAELDVPIPLTLVFEYPTVAEAVQFLLNNINATSEDPELQAKMLNTVWRAMGKALGRDPVKVAMAGHLEPDCWPRSYTEEDALGVLAQLRSVYEADSWVQATRSIARRVAFEQRSFVVHLRTKALEVQAPILEEHGFDPDSEGMRKLECALVHVAQRSARVRSELMTVRMAVYGGPDGMWAINMEDHAEEVFADSHCMQSRVHYTKVDPFGPNRINTNSTYMDPMGA